MYSKKAFAMQFDENEVSYRIYGYDGPEIIFTIIYKGEIPVCNMTQEQNDLYKSAFESLYKAKCNGTIAIQKLNPFSEACGLRLRTKGIHGTAAKGTTSDAVIYRLTENRRLSGLEVFLKGQSVDDTIDFLIVDIDNITGRGAGLVLDCFGESICVDPDRCGQGQIHSDYSALLSQGLYVVMRYTSTGTSDVIVKANLFLHKVTT